MKSNLRRISCLVTAQTLGNLKRLAKAGGYGADIGRAIDDLTREKMIKRREDRLWRD